MSIRRRPVRVGYIPAVDGRPMPEEQREAAEHEDHHPRGTFVLLVGFLIMTAGYWVWTFLTLLERAG